MRLISLTSLTPRNCGTQHASVTPELCRQIAVSDRISGPRRVCNAIRRLPGNVISWARSGFPRSNHSAVNASERLNQSRTSMLFDPIPSPGSQQWFENEAHRERIVSAVMDLHRLDLPPGNISDALEIPLSAVDEILDLLGTVRVTEDPPPSYEDAINEGGVTEDPPPSYEDAIKMERVGNNSTSTKVS